MSKIMLSDTVYAICPEGEHVFRISNATHDEKFGTVIITLKTSDGYSDTERYQLVDGQGVINEGALGAFSYLAKCAMNDMTLRDIDPQQLINRYIKATVSHTVKPSTKKPGATVTFTSISDIKTSSKEEFEAAVPQQPTSTTQTSSKFDLNAILGQRK